MRYSLAELMLQRNCACLPEDVTKSGRAERGQNGANARCGARVRKGQNVKPTAGRSPREDLQ
jgi:hypothetical protein